MKDGRSSLETGRKSQTRDAKTQDSRVAHDGQSIAEQDRWGKKRDIYIYIYMCERETTKPKVARKCSEPHTEEEEGGGEKKT